MSMDFFPSPDGRKTTAKKYSLNMFEKMCMVHVDLCRLFQFALEPSFY